MSQFTILHNPHCSKSRGALALLLEHNIDPMIIEYQKEPPSKKELTHIASLLHLPPIQIIRSNEPLFKELGLSKTSTDNELFDAMTSHPILIERPIIIKNNTTAIIARPTERILPLL